MNNVSAVLPPVPGDAVRSAIVQILEVMYFCEADFRGPARINSDALVTSLDFSGGTSGKFRVAVSPCLAARLATDFLALGPGEASPEEIDATVKELANVACGAALNSWMPQASFHFSVPAALSVLPGGGEFRYCFAVSGVDADLAIDVTGE